ncbi:MAG: nucleoside phosphorylase [Elusimicrobiales bacterium]|jgi:uridine phosphorylase|nr:nucleoside phosphorylase [Elusimicrobiales bacterium]
MSYPVVKSKYKYASLTSPEQYIKQYKKHSGNTQNLIVVYAKSFFDILIKNFNFKKKYSNLYRINENYDLFLCQIGSPNIGMCVEEFSVNGYKNFFAIGVCGAINNDLEIGDIIVCNRALRDEGTSYHYIKASDYIDCNKNFLSSVEKKLKSNMIGYSRRTVWTTDAPYRETYFEIKKNLNMGVDCVDMETSAFYAVAEYKKVNAISIFTVSDVLDVKKKKWNMFFNSKIIYNNFLKIFNAIV